MKERNINMEEKEVYSSSDDILVDQICQILKNNDINYIRSDDGATAYLNVAWGNNLGIKRIFVNSDEFEKAAQLIEELIQNNDDNISEEKNYEESIPEELRNNNEEEDEELNKDINKYKRLWRILFAWIPLSFTIIAILLTIIIDFIIVK